MYKCWIIIIILYHYKVIMINLKVSRAPKPASLTGAVVDFKMLVVTIAEFWAGIDISKPSSPV